MASTREERMQQRLRGAQKRDIVDVDFGLTFPDVNADPITEDGQGGLVAVKSSRKTPRRDLRASTPRSTELHGRRTPVLDDVVRYVTGKEGNATASANISAKRRRLDNTIASKDGSSFAGLEKEVVGAQAEGSNEMENTSSMMILREVAGPRRTTLETDDVYNLLDQSDELDEKVDQQEVVRRGPSTKLSATRHPPSSSVRRVSARSSRQSPEPKGASEEVMESPTDAPGSGHRTRSSGATIRSILPLSDASINATPTPRTSAMGKKRKSASESTKISAKISGRMLSSSGHDEEGADDVDELSPEQPKERRKRTISDLLAHPRDETDLASQGGDNEVDELEEAEVPPIRIAGLQSKGNRRRKPQRESPVLDKVAASSPAKLIKKRKGRRNMFSSPAQQRQPKPKSLKASSKLPNQASGNPIPVTVHRLAGGTVYDENDSDADILNAEIPHAKRIGVNSTDVLSQICQEIIAAGLDSLEHNGAEIEDRRVRREYRTKWKAIEMFGMEMGTRLVEQTINLDHVYALEKRVRDELRKKIGLRDEILRIRAERQQVALRMDEVRVRHEMERSADRSRDSLNNTMHDVELAVERGQRKSGVEIPTDIRLSGVELAVKRVVGSFSRMSGSGGLLRQIQAFNGFLERAAGALEGRVASLA